MIYKNENNYKSLLKIAINRDVKNITIKFIDNYGAEKLIFMLVILYEVWGNVKYFNIRYGEEPQVKFNFNVDKIAEVQKECVSILNELLAQTWCNDEAKEEMIICAEGICVLAQLGAKMFDVTAENIVDVNKWIVKYKNKWLQKNKESEVSKIEEMLLYINNL